MNTTTKGLCFQPFMFQFSSPCLFFKQNHANSLLKKKKVTERWYFQRFDSAGNTSVKNVENTRAFLKRWYFQRFCNTLVFSALLNFQNAENTSATSLKKISKIDFAHSCFRASREEAASRFRLYSRQRIGSPFLSLSLPPPPLLFPSFSLSPLPCLAHAHERGIEREREREREREMCM